MFALASGASFRPNSNIPSIVANLAKPKVVLMEAASGREVWAYGGHNSPVNSLSFSKDGKYVLTGSGGLQDNGVWCGPSRTRDSVGVSDADWYAVTAPRFKTLTFRATFSGADGDIDMRLYNSGGGYLLASTGAGDEEEISYEVLSQATFFLEVYLATGTSGGNAYALQVLTEHPLVERAQAVDGQVDGGSRKLALGDEVEYPRPDLRLPK